MEKGQEKNKVYAVRYLDDWWAVVDCGKTQRNIMVVGNYWNTHFRHGDNTFRRYNKIFNPPEDLQEWQEIKIVDKTVTVLSDNDYFMQFEGFENAENRANQSLVNFAKLLGHNLSVEDVVKLTNQ